MFVWYMTMNHSRLVLLNCTRGCASREIELSHPGVVHCQIPQHHMFSLYDPMKVIVSLLIGIHWWPYIGRDSNHCHFNCLFNNLLRFTAKKTEKFRITGLLWGESTVYSSRGIIPVWQNFSKELLLRDINILESWYYHYNIAILYWIVPNCMPQDSLQYRDMYYYICGIIWAALITAYRTVFRVCCSGV